ncbi:MAG: hypothetical protein JWO36_3378 [Myxococcales bacterium]|nr:hypothetical protein [Myxococcales bacterium]
MRSWGMSAVVTVAHAAPLQILRSAVERLHAVADADVAGYYRVARRADGTACIVGTLGVGRGFDDVFKCILRRPGAIESMARSLVAPPRAETTGFVEFDRLVTRHVVEFRREDLFRPAGFVEQIRLLVYHGPRFVGWIGAMRRLGASAFSRRDSDRLASLVRPVSDAVIAADALAHVEAPGNAYAVVRPNGSVEYATPAARAWLDGPGHRAAVRRWVIAADRNSETDAANLFAHHDARLVRLDSAGGVRYLLKLAPILPILRSLVLSPRQREVAELAADGATVDEIAADVACDRETVRSHLRAIYQRLGVSTRVELARALARL